MLTVLARRSHNRTSDDPNGEMVPAGARFRSPRGLTRLPEIENRWDSLSPRLLYWLACEEPSAALCTANGEFLVGASDFYSAAESSCASTWFDCWHFDPQRSLRRQLDCVPLALPVLPSTQEDTGKASGTPTAHWQSQWHTNCALAKPVAHQLRTGQSQWHPMRTGKASGTPLRTGKASGTPIAHWQSQWHTNCAECGSAPLGCGQRRDRGKAATQQSASAPG